MHRVKHWFWTSGLLIGFSLGGWGQCDGNHTVILQNFEFTPETLTIAPGDSVSFINIEGIHTVNGVTNSVTNEPFDNPVPFALPQALGTIEGTCMGTFTFQVPGTYSYDCSVGFNAQAGMQAAIVVDAYDLADLLADLQNADTVSCWESAYAFQVFAPEVLSSLGQHTLFLPDGDAIDEAMGFMNLGQFDMLAIPDFPAIMQYHAVPGVWDLDDLEDGMLLNTVQGQTLPVVVNEEGTFVGGARIVQTGFEAFNGLAHVIDSVLAPTGLPAPHVWSVIQDSPNHTILELAIASAYLTEPLSFQVVIDDSYSEPGPWTVWAPTDAAFEVLMEEQGWDLNDLLSSQYLVELVQNHVIQSIWMDSDLSSGLSLVNLNGTTHSIGGVPGQWTVGPATVLETDVVAYNGVVHVIDEVLAPEIEVPEGTCGVWTLELTSPNAANGEGWEFNGPFDGVYVELQINQSVLDLVTLPGGSSFNYEFGVDVGDVVNAVFYDFGDAYLPGYRLFDGEGVLLVEEQGTFNSPTASTFGLHACENPYENACGFITVQFEDEYGDGWDVGALLVFVDDELTYELTMAAGTEQDIVLPVNAGAMLDFVYQSSYFPQENGYRVLGVDGDLLVDEAVLGQSPGNALNVVPCPSSTDGVDGEGVSSWMLVPNPAHSGSFALQGPQSKNVRVTIFNALGSLVKTVKSWSGEPISTQGWAPGSYVVTVTSDSSQGTWRQRLVVQ